MKKKKNLKEQEKYNGRQPDASLYPETDEAGFIVSDAPPRKSSSHAKNRRKDKNASDNAAGGGAKSYTKSIVVGVVIIALLCGGAFGIFKVIQNLDYMRPVKDICGIYNNRETDVADVYKAAYSGKDRKAYNSAYKIIANSDEYYSYFDSLPEELEAYYRDNAASGGSGIKMKFDTTGDKVKMDESQLAIIYKEFESAAPYYSAIVNGVDNMGKDDWQRMADSMGISLKRAQSLGSAIRKRCAEYTSFNITSGYYITGRYVLINAAGDTVEKTEKITLAVIKLNGSWYLYEGRSDGLMLATGSSFFAEEDILWEIYEKYIQ